MSKRVGRPFELLPAPEEPNIQALIMHASNALKLELKKETPDNTIVFQLLNRMDELRAQQQSEDDHKLAVAFQNKGHITPSEPLAPYEDFIYPRPGGRHG
jgi:hypothetical protein